MPLVLVAAVASETMDRALEGRAGPAPAPAASLAALGSGTGLAILDHLPDPLIVLDGGGRIMLRNAAAERLIGGAILGKHVAAVLRSAPRWEPVHSERKRAASGPIHGLRTSSP